MAELPWMALLQYKKNNGRSLTFACGGTLISKRYVLTAAHCVSEKINRDIGRLLVHVTSTWFSLQTKVFLNCRHRVRLGEWNTETEKDCVSTLGYADCNDPPLDVPVQEIIPHPSFTDESHNKVHDIALLRLKQNVHFTGEQLPFCLSQTNIQIIPFYLAYYRWTLGTQRLFANTWRHIKKHTNHPIQKSVKALLLLHYCLSDFIRPICLPPAEDGRSEVGQQLLVAGWGRTEYSNFSPTKLKLQIPAVSDRQCAAKFQTLRVTLAESHLCAGGESGRDSCNGDSGGPLMDTFKDDSGQWYIKGIVSFGAKCGLEGWPGVYTRVSSYLPWIRQNVRAWNWKGIGLSVTSTRSTRTVYFEEDSVVIIICFVCTVHLLI